MAFCFGLNGTLESKVSQSYGAQNYEMCGVWLNRGKAINTILMIPMVFLFFSSKHILEAIGIAEELSISARFYCCLMIPGVWAMTQFDATKRYCTSQLKSNPPFICQLVTSVLHFAWCTIFIQAFKWELVGAAISLNITYFLNMIALDLYVRFSKEFEGTYVPHDARSLQEWPVYLRIGLFGAILECLGWWNLHICFLFSGYLGTTSVSTQVIVMQIKNFTTMIPTGVAFAASGFVGNCIGMNQVERARNYADVSINYSMFLTFIIICIFMAGSHTITHFFTSDDTLAEATEKTFWSLFLYIFFSTVKGV